MMHFCTCNNFKLWVKFTLPQYIEQLRVCATIFIRRGKIQVQELNIVDTMLSVYSVLFTLMLFSELSSHLVTVAMPATKIEDSLTEQDALGSFLGDELMSEPVVVAPLHRQSLLLDNVGDEDGNSKIIVSVSNSVIVSVSYCCCRCIFKVWSFLNGN